MEKIDEKKTSIVMYELKALAIISVVLAHSFCHYINNEYLRSFIAIIKTLGVYLFFIIAGYYYKTEKYKNILELFKDKFVKLVIPWLISGTVIYLLKCRASGFHFSIVEITNWILGNATYLYYMSMLFSMYIIYYILPKKNTTYYIAMIITIISITLLDIKVLPTSVYDKKVIFTYLNPYLNVLNWIGIFALGILTKKYLINNRVTKIKVIIGTLIYIGIVTVTVYLKIELGYWKVIALILGVLNFYLLFYALQHINDMKLVADIGKKSFTIYLWHLPIIGKISSRMPPEYSLFAAIISVLLMYIAIKIGEYVSKKLKINELYNIITGNR